MPQNSLISHEIIKKTGAHKQCVKNVILIVKIRSG